MGLEYGSGIWDWDIGLRWDWNMGLGYWTGTGNGIWDLDMGLGYGTEMGLGYGTGKWDLDMGLGYWTGTGNGIWDIVLGPQGIPAQDFYKAIRILLGNIAILLDNSKFLTIIGP